jgi:hypothetical protein
MARGFSPAFTAPKGRARYLSLTTAIDPSPRYGAG